MRQMVLLSFVLAFVGTSIAGYEFKQRVRPRLDKSSIKIDSFITEGSQGYATPSNATYQGLMYHHYRTGWPEVLQYKILHSLRITISIINIVVSQKKGPWVVYLTLGSAGG